MRALLHAHTTYSYDGEPSPRELARWGASRGLDLILLSEHANDFDQEKMERFVAEIDALSDESCRLVPGLEFAVRGGFHVLGYNLRAFEPLVEPLAAVRFIRDQGGLAVLAHPGRYAGRWPDPETMASFHGIEAWNARYDGRFLPSGRVFQSVRTMLAGRADQRFYAGQDLHRVGPYRLVVTRTDEAADLEGFLRALAAGRVRFGAPGLWFASDSCAGIVSPALLEWGHRSYRWVRGVRDRIAG